MAIKGRWGRVGGCRVVVLCDRCGKPIPDPNEGNYVVPRPPSGAGDVEVGHYHASARCRPPVAVDEDGEPLAYMGSLVHCLTAPPVDLADEAWDGRAPSPPGDPWAEGAVDREWPDDEEDEEEGDDEDDEGEAWRSGRRDGAE